MKRILIIDGNNQAYRAYHKLSGMRGGVKGPSSIVYGVIQTVKTLVDKYKPYKVLIPFDGGKSNYRLVVHPEYKKREKSSDFDYKNFKSQTMDLRKMLSCLNCKVYWKKGFEADDIIYNLTLKYSDTEKYEVIIVSSDKDFNQLLIYKNVRIFNSISQVTLTPNTFYGRMGYHAYQTVDFLSLWGDKSDNIPGYPGIGEVTGKRFLEEFNSIEEYIKLNPQKPFRKIDIVKLKEIYSLNKRLIGLDQFHNYMVKSGNKYPKSVPLIEKFDIGEFREYCNLYGITKLKSELYLESFKKIKSKGNV